jgi:AcrR family transcriptional regulator
METEPSKSVDLRSRLLEAAQQVFAESGYASATVEDIITAASTSRATFYRYFRSKEDLFDELSRSCFRDMRALTKALVAFDPVADGQEGLEKLIAAYTEMQERQRGVVRAWMEQVDRPESSVRKEAATTFHALLTGLEHRITVVGSPSDVDAEVQAALLLILLNRATFYVLHRHSRVDPNRLPPTLATMVRRAYFGGTSERRGRLRVATKD